MLDMLYSTIGTSTRCLLASRLKAEQQFFIASFLGVDRRCRPSSLLFASHNNPDLGHGSDDLACTAPGQIPVAGSLGARMQRCRNGHCLFVC